MPEVIRKISTDQPLRVKPQLKPPTPVIGEFEGEFLEVQEGEKVMTGNKPDVDEIVEGETFKWIFVEAIDGQNVDRRKGYVPDTVLDREDAAIEMPGAFQAFPAEVEKEEFAGACYVQAELSHTNPAYLYALAFALSGEQWSDTQVKTNDPPSALAFGVYQFPKPTWAALLQLNDGGNLADQHIKFPTAQCVIAGLLAAKSASLLKEKITDRGLSAVDLLLTHLFADDNSFGSNAAARILQAEKDKKEQPSSEVIKQIYPNDVARADFLKRNQAFFKEDGSATIEQALKACTEKLGAGFAEVKKLAKEISSSIFTDANGPLIPEGGVNVDQDKSINSILTAANKEWEFWGRSTPQKVGHIDDELNFAIYVRDTYCAPLSVRPPLSDIQNDRFFWSAVTISYIVRQAGLKKSEFKFSTMHSQYIREAVKARKDNNKSKAYWGYRITEKEAALAPGDIIGCMRTKMSHAQAQAFFDATEDYPSHSDIVVAVRPGEADVVGGNVKDSVTKKTVTLDGSGRISDKSNLWFVVMKKNAPSQSAEGEEGENVGGSAGVRVARKLKSGASVPLANQTEILAALNEVSASHDVDPAAIAGVIHTEFVWDTRAVTGSFIGLTQVGPDFVQNLGLTKKEFLNLSAPEQIRAYGKWLDFFKFSLKMKANNIDCLALPLSRQAAVLQAMQFAPNARKWKEALSAGDLTVRSTDTKQAALLGDTSIGQMEKFYAGFFKKNPPEPS